VKPNRTDTNRRLYSNAEIERLQLLRRATEAGHSIKNIAGLETGKLEGLVTTADAPPAATRTQVPAANNTFVQECISATQRLDGVAFEDVLARAAISLGQHGLLEQVVAPVAEAIGEMWRDGLLTAAHEHFASAAIRVFLGQAARAFALPASAPNLIVATPVGQLHELGAVMVAAAAADLGWRVTYLGTSLPAAEIVGPAMQNRAKAVALSIIYPGDDEGLPAELERLRRYLPPEIKIMVGGRASGAYTDAFKRIGAIHITNLREFCSQLDDLRPPSRRASVLKPK
jgi:methylmalonyl-CoA mutase cobalamin-binding domain/chain